MSLSKAPQSTMPVHCLLWPSRQWTQFGRVRRPELAAAHAASHACTRVRAHARTQHAHTRPAAPHPSQVQTYTRCLAAPGYLLGPRGEASPRGRLAVASLLAVPRPQPRCASGRSPPLQLSFTGTRAHTHQTYYSSTLQKCPTPQRQLGFQRDDPASDLRGDRIPAPTTASTPSPSPTPP